MPAASTDENPTAEAGNLRSDSLNRRFVPPHCQLLLVHASFGQNYLTVDLKVARDSRCVANRLSCAYR